MLPTAAVAFSLTFFLALALVGLAEYRRAAVGERLAVVRSQRRKLDTEHLLDQPRDRAANAEDGVDGDESGGFRAVRGLFVGWLQRSLVRRGRHRVVEARLKQAGWRLRAAEYFSLRLGGGLFLGLAAGLVRGPAWFLPVAAAGFLLPEVLVERAIKKRRRAFVIQLPDMLTTVSNSLRTGFSFLQAVEVAAEEMERPAAVELRQVVRETQVDIPLEDALANLYVRMPIPEVQLVVTAVIIQRQVGGNLAGLLDQVGETVRMRLSLERELSALTSQGRLSGWIVGLLPIGIGGLLFFVNPHYIGLLFTDILGQVLLAGAGTLEILGAFIIRRMVRMGV